MNRERIKVTEKLIPTTKTIISLLKKDELRGRIQPRGRFYFDELIWLIIPNKFLDTKVFIFNAHVGKIVI